MYIGFHVKYPLLLSDFSEMGIFLDGILRFNTSSYVARNITVY